MCLGEERSRLRGVARSSSPRVSTPVPIFVKLIKLSFAEAKLADPPKRPPASPEHPAAAGIRSTLLGILVNALLAGIKGITGIFGNSSALIADAVESTSDIVTSLIVLGGLRFAQRPPDADHPYGHGKAEPLAAMAVAIALLAAAAGIAVLSVREILTPHHIPELYTFWVLLGVVAVKEGLFRIVWRTGSQTGSGAVKADAWHHRSDAITSLAAAVGICAAIWWRYAPADDWAALLAAAVIAANGVRLLKPALMEITDAAPPAEVGSRVREVAGAVAGVV
ncbi:MAG: cation transporter, partial [Planctomycetes bacterium]|nr:cation transporter [Planctomycetota bacterium]